MELVIGNKNLSSWSARPWILMRHAEIAFDERVMLFETPGFRDAIAAASPSARVPLLRDGDVLVWESLAIAEYLADRFPEKNLWPADRVARAQARAVSAEMHAGFANLRRELSMDVTLRTSRRVLSSEAENELRRIERIWSESRARFGGSGDFLFGAFSIADAMFAPVAWRFRTYDVKLEDAAARAYQGTMLALPAMKSWERDAAAETPLHAADPIRGQHAFAVIFSSKLVRPEGYAALADAMETLAAKQPGFLGIDSARGTDGFGITVSYWDSLEAIRRWKDNAAHRSAQLRGKTFYERYEIRVARVERGSKFP